MTQKLQNISLTNWRSKENQAITFEPKLTIFCGPNAAGKTNMLEAIELLTTGISFRHPKAQDLVKQGEKSAQSSITIVDDTRIIDIVCTITENKKRFYRLGKPVQARTLPQEILPVLFTPDHLALIKQSASWRRDELDIFGSLAHPMYRKLYKDYLKTLKQRNQLLKNSTFTQNEIEVWNEELAYFAARLLWHRYNLFQKLTHLTQDIYKKITNNETLHLVYHVSHIPDIDEALQHISQSTLSEEEQKKELQLRYIQAYKNTYPLDIKLQQTTVGPHRDDIVFLLNTLNARSFASQGQQRSLVLSWKLAQVEFIQQTLSQTPLLLLDDVMSELDDKRREAIINYVNQGVQTIITTTHLGYFHPYFLQQAKVVDFNV